MNKKVGAALLLLSIAPAQATIIVDDGGDHAISGRVTEDYEISNGSQVSIGANSSITAGGPLSSAVVLRGQSTRPVDGERRSVLEISGNARIVGTAYEGVLFRSGYSDLRVRDNGYVSTIDTYVAYGGWDAEAAQRVFLGGRATVGEMRMTGYVSMEDNARIAGMLYGTGPLTASLNGGMVQGEMLLGGNDVHTVSLNGTSLLGGFRTVSSIVTFEMTDGLIAGSGMQVLGHMNADIYGGHIEGGVRTMPADTYMNTRHEFSFFGGSVDAGANDWLIDLNRRTDMQSPGFSLLDIRGGQFGYASAGNGFLIDGLVNFDLYGWDLTVVNGRLTGFLADGNRIDVGLSFGPSWQGLLNINDVSVPEPGTMPLVLLALAGFAFARRARPARD